MVIESINMTYAALTFGTNIADIKIIVLSFRR